MSTIIQSCINVPSEPIRLKSIVFSNTIYNYDNNKNYHYYSNNNNNHINDDDDNSNNNYSH